MIDVILEGKLKRHAKRAVELYRTMYGEGELLQANYQGAVKLGDKIYAFNTLRQQDAIEVMVMERTGVHLYSDPTAPGPEQLKRIASYSFSVVEP